MTKRSHQGSLFDNDPGAPDLPEGFKYQPDFISPDDEQQLVQQIRTLPLKEFEFQGFLGKRRVVSFGWRYDFNERELQRADDIPPFLLPLRQRAEVLAGLPAGSLQHVLITEYAAGAGIGWHRDKATFDEVMGVSFLSPCD